MKSITTAEYNAYYQPYIDNVNYDLSIVEGLKQNQDVMVSCYSIIPVEKHNYAYAVEKWTVKDVLLHIIDTERVFAYRALRIARRDNTPLAGYEQDDYVLNAFAENRTMKSLIEEYKSVRQATITLFESFSPDTLLLVGKASGFPISVRAIGYVIVGHENHHSNIINERYL